jgi:hypothetical protein
VLIGAGAAHPLMNPYLMPANAACRRNCSRDMCARSLAIVDRTVMVPMDPRHDDKQIEDIIHNIGVAARVALADAPLAEAELRATAPVDAQKFDIAG